MLLLQIAIELRFAAGARGRRKLFDTDKKVYRHLFIIILFGSDRIGWASAYGHGWADGHACMSMHADVVMGGFGG